MGVARGVGMGFFTGVAVFTTAVVGVVELAELLVLYGPQPASNVRTTQTLRGTSRRYIRFIETPFWIPSPFMGRKERKACACMRISIFCSPRQEEIGVGLGTLLRKRETVRLRVPFQLSGPGSRQERHVWVKHSWSRTLLVRHAEPGRASCQKALMRQPMKPKRLSRKGVQRCGRG